MPAVSAADDALVAPRLVLRRFRHDDTPAFTAYRSDPVVARYQAWTTPVSPGVAAELVRTLADSDPDQPGWFQYAIERTADHRLIGDLGVCLHDNGLQAEVGFTLAAPAQGCGYATEALTHILDHLFVDRGLRRVSAECDARNLASARLLRRVGFSQEGYRPANTWLKGEWTDDLLFGLLASDLRSGGRTRDSQPSTEKP